MTDFGKGNGSIRVQEGRPARLLTWPEDLERYFDAHWRRWPFRPVGRLPRRVQAAAWIPEMDVLEKNGKVVVRTDLPGLTPENIDVSVEGDVLTIKGHREEEKEVKEEDFYCSERAAGDFFRAVRLPEGVTADGIEAHYENGVLEVTLPKPAAAEAKPVKIQVK